MRRGNHADQPPHAAAASSRQRVFDERPPVAHADVDRQREAARGQPLAQPARLPLGDRRDRRDAAEELVVVRDRLDPLRRNAARPQHVLQERPDVVGALRPAEGDEEHGVEGRRHGRSMCDRRRFVKTVSAASTLSADRRQI